MNEASFFEGLKKNSNEQEKPPRTIFMITRHADRLPNGELSQEGIKKAKEKGKKIGELRDSLILKGYASDEKTKRTVKTSNLISQESECVPVEEKIISPRTGQPYKTREVEGIQYGVLKPDLGDVLQQGIDLGTTQN